MGRDPNERVSGVLDKATLAEHRKSHTYLVELSMLMEEWSNEGMIIESVVIQGPEKTGGNFLAIIKAIDEGRNRFVAFRSSDDVRGMIAKIAEDARNGVLVFKEEKPWTPEGARASKGGKPVGE